MQLSFKSDEFDGPLDLLLYLISKHKMNILDIEIMTLIDQYMEYMDNLETEDLETAGEFIDMAARLVHMKTVMLLPKHEEEKKIMKEELTEELIEHKTLKEATEQLDKINHIEEIYVSPGEKLELDKIFTGTLSTKALKNAYFAAVGRGQRLMPPPKSDFEPIVTQKFVSVTVRIVYILKKLYINPCAKIIKFFDVRKEKSKNVATFLAVLELIKSKRVKISDDGETIIFIRKNKQRVN